MSQRRQLTWPNVATPGTANKFAGWDGNGDPVELDGLLKIVVEIPAAEFRTIGSIPVELIPSPGAGKYINIISATISNDAGTTGYDFTDTVIIKNSGSLSGDSFGQVETAININGAWIRKFQWSNTSGFTAPVANQSQVISTLDGSDATTGDRDVKVTVYYTIDDV